MNWSAKQPRTGSPEDARRDDAAPASDESGEIDAALAKLTSERDEAIAARQRALADFANFQRRADEAEMRAVQTGAAKVVRSLINPLDHFDLALNQDVSKLSVERLLDGVKMVREELGRTLESLGVTVIAPRRGDEFDPQRHEAMLRQPAGDLEPDHIVQVFQPGYAMGDMVLRPAKVAVSGES